MTFAVRSLNLGQMYGVLHVASERRAFAAMIGSAGYSAWGDDCMSRLLVDAMATLDDAAPASLAEALRSRLSVDGDPPDLPSWIFYAAALVRPGAVDVCHAGDVRVQYVRAGTVVHSTIDHTAGNLGLPGQPAGTPAPAVHRTVVVRSLGRGNEPPTCATWPLEGAARLVIASSEVHGHRPREQPIAWPDDGFTDRHGAGAIIELCRAGRSGDR